MKRVYMVYTSGLLHRVYATGMSCDRISGDPGFRWWEVMAFSIIKYVGLSGDFRLFDVCFCQTFAESLLLKKNARFPFHLSFVQPSLYTSDYFLLLFDFFSNL